VRLHLATGVVGRIALGAAWILLTYAPTALAWGDKGHKVVAMVAESRLTPAANAAVQRLIGPSKLRDVSTWADQIKGARPETKPWHYVNIPLDRTDYDPARDCGRPPGGCVVAVIERLQRVLADPSRSRQERVEALKFVTHFVADLHQPLHCADNRDGGGNDVLVVFFGQVLNGSARTPWNLHAVWDAGLIERRGLKPSEHAKRLTRGIDRESASRIERGTVVDWALESHRAAVETSYRLPPDRVLGDDYADNAFPVVDDMLARAGVRLAKMLNDALGR
jgi:hypothetical protein